MNDPVGQDEQAVVHHVLARLNHVHLHAVEDRREDGRAPQSATLDCHSVVCQQVVEVVDVGLFAQPKAIHVDVVAVNAFLLQYKVRDAAETQRFELVLVTVGLKNLSNLLDGKLIVIWSLIERPQLVQISIGGCEINGDSHIDVPSCLEIINETGLLDYLEDCKLNCSCKL